MGSTPFEFGSANLDANGELGRFCGSLVVSADSMESTSKNLEVSFPETKDQIRSGDKGGKGGLRQDPQ